MSLINQMLKDIDKREGEQQQAGRSTSRYETSKRVWPAWLFMALGVISTVVVLLLVLWVWRVMNTPATVAVEAVTSPVEETLNLQPQAQPQSLAQPRQARPPMAETLAKPVAVPVVEAATQAKPAPTPKPVTEPQTAAATPEPVVTPVPEVEPEPVGEMAIQRSNTPPKVLAERRFQQAMSDLQGGRTQQGAQRLQEALLMAPDYHEARQQLAVYYFSYGFLTDALAVLEQGLEEFPGETGLVLVQARILERAGEPAMALNALRNVANELPANADLLILRGALASELEDYQVASETYQVLTSWRPREGRWWLGLALAQQQLQLTEQALQAFRRALDDPSIGTATREFIHQRVEELR